MATIDQEIAKVERDIDKVDSEIDKIQLAIDQAASKYEAAFTDRDKEYWRNKEARLQDEKAQLRDKEARLRDEKVQLRDEKARLQVQTVAGASGSSASDASWAVQLISKEVSKELSKELKPLAKGVILALQPVLSQLRRTSSATRSEGMRSGTFKKNLVQLKYNINDPMYLLDCSVTMLKLPSFAVLGAHIFPVRAANYLGYICPDIASIDDTHNGVLWAEPIEEAFESSSICFSWNEVNHTLTPRVLDINLLGKDMLAAYRYLKGKEGVELEVAEEAMPYEQMEIAVRSIYEQLEKSHLSSKQKEKQRTDQQEILWPYINFLYKKTSFDAINGVAIPFPAHIQLSVRAFQLSAAMAFNEAKQRGVLPPNLNFNPGIECGGDSGVIDLYLTSQVSSDDDDDDFISDSDSSFDIVPFVAA